MTTLLLIFMTVSSLYCAALIGKAVGTAGGVPARPGVRLAAGLVGKRIVTATAPFFRKWCHAQRD